MGMKARTFYNCNAMPVIFMETKEFFAESRKTSIDSRVVTATCTLLELEGAGWSRYYWRAKKLTFHLQGNKRIFRRKPKNEYWFTSGDSYLYTFRTERGRVIKALLKGIEIFIRIEPSLVNDLDFESWRKYDSN